MKKKINVLTIDGLNINFEEIFFYLFFSIMLVTKGIGLIEGHILYTLGILAGAGCFVIKILLTRYSLMEYFISALLGIFSMIAFLNTREKGILFTFMLLLAMKNMSVKKVFQLGLFIWSITFWGLILIHLLGISNDLILAHEKLGLGHILRYSLGFPHPNVLQISYVIFMMFFFYVCKPKGKWLFISTILLFIGDCYIFLYSISYTGFILSVIYLIAVCYFMTRKKISKLESFCIQLVLPFCALLSILGPVTFKGRLFDIFNKILNTRFNLSRYFLMNQKITLFGSPLVEAPNTFVIDCSYVSCLLIYGLILFSFIMGAYFFMIRKYLKEDKRAELAIIISILVAGASEPFLFNTSFKNLSIIFMGSWIFQTLSAYNKNEIMYMERYSLAETFLLILVEGKKKLSAFASISFHNLKENVVRWSLISAAVGVIISGIYAVTWDRPSAIYMPVSQSDKIQQEPVLIDQTKLPEDFDSWILQTNSKEVPLAKFSGDIVTLEHIRAVVSCFLIIFSFSMIIIAIGTSIRKSLVNIT